MHYYNEHDKNAAAWLRELITRGLIPSGEVDERSIEDVTPAELFAFTQCHFFAGIGGWSKALQLASIQPTRRLWTGSCPCQPFSTAGKGEGTADERHLWPAFKWLIEQCRPPTVFGEQVASAAGREWLAGVRSDLEGLAYEVGAADLCAAGVGAPHIRQRLFWVAYHQGQGRAGVESQRQAGKLVRARAGSSGTDGGLVLSNLSGREPGRVAAATAGHRCAAESAGSPRGMCNTRCQRDEPRRGAGDVGRTADQEQSEAREWQRGGDADSGAGFDDDAFWRLDNSTGPRLIGQVSHTERNPREEARVRLSGLGRPWDDYQLIPCRDGKSRRVESGVEPLAPRLPGGVVPVGDCSVQEAQATGEARVARLKGYGNAIVSQVAAEFILAAEAARHDRAGELLGVTPI